MGTVTGYPLPPDQQPTGFIYSPPTQPPKRGMSTGLILGIVAAVVGVLCIGATVAIALMPAAKTTPPAAVEATTTAVPTTLAPTTAAATTAPTTAAATKAAGPLTSFKDGTYEIGTTAGMVAPGKYKATVPNDSWNCYWERLRGLSGQFSDIIANGNADPGTPVIVTIAPSDKGFTSNGCGTWTKS